MSAGARGEAGGAGARGEAGGGPALASAVVVGTGLMGASVGLALARRGVAVHLRDRDEGTRRRAAELGAGSLAAPSARTDVAVLAVPPHAVAAELLAAQAQGLARTCLDLASVKVLPLREAAALGVDLGCVVGSHPVAGRETSGPGAARSDLFEGRPWVLTPAPATGAEHVARARALVELCGAVPVVMGPEDHDEALALVSHAPQVLASLLAARLRGADPAHVELSGQGIRDATRIAASDPELWTAILSGNPAPVARVLREVRADLDAVLDALDALGGGAPAGAGGPAEVLRGALRRGNDGRARMPGKHGTPPAAYAPVPVVLEDRPGQLARLFADADAAGVNIEDVRIEHSPGQPVGRVELAVRPARAPVLVAALRGRGWTVQT